MPTSKGFPCNTCNLSFGNSQAQRTHMREGWHVYNLKRRMSSLPPMSEDTYIESVATTLVTSNQRATRGSPAPITTMISPEVEVGSMEEVGNDEVFQQDQSQLGNCLFCSKDSDELNANMEHMASEHGLYIPELELISSLEVLIGYLRQIITQYNECLYCGMFKQSVHGVQQHMLDKGHCMINFEREPEILEFWNLSDGDESGSNGEEKSTPGSLNVDAANFQIMSEGEYSLPSGKVIESKSKAREARILARRKAMVASKLADQEAIEDAVASPAEPSSSDEAEALVSRRNLSQSREVAVRDANGLIGVSDQQVRGLITVERKMQRQQAVVQASRVWADELGGRSQKHGKVKMNLRAG